MVAAWYFLLIVLPFYCNGFYRLSAADLDSDQFQLASHFPYTLIFSNTITSIVIGGLGLWLPTLLGVVVLPGICVWWLAGLFRWGWRGVTLTRNEVIRLLPEGIFLVVVATLFLFNFRRMVAVFVAGD